MVPQSPFLLVRARPAEGADEHAFGRWFREVHLRDAAKIPGVGAVEWGRSPNGAWLGLFSFESAETVQTSLSSPEAAYARGTWQRWMPRLAELHVELFAPVVPLPMYAGQN
ncbi:MAG: hypothetical protein ACE5EF_00285 [Dehalococcoidia bacterium]